jgi:archaellum component FlaC
MDHFSTYDLFGECQEKIQKLETEVKYYKQKIDIYENNLVEGDRCQTEEVEEEVEADHIFLGKLIHQRPDNVKIYASSTKRLFPNVDPWVFNRLLDLEHVKKLQTIMNEKACFEGNIDILECKEELCVVNGQHRVEAIKELMKEDETFDREVLVNVHPVSSFESEEANEIFRATNNNKNVEMRDNPQTKFQNICNRLKDRYPGGITSNKSGKANLHRLDKKQLYNLMQYNEYFNDETNTEEVLFQKIIELNTELSTSSYETLLGRRGAKKDKRYHGACKDNFYMGLVTETQLAIMFQTRFK